ncbi:MAG: hypothetical protein KF878_00085 [Planctomycetes bacterium]|nr:hypothetical protein [Planctomycetota bacterium]
MSVSKLYLDYAVKLHAATAQSAAAVYVDGVRAASLNTGLRTMVEAGDGEVFGSFGSLVAGAPVARFTSVDLAVVLAQVGFSGMLVNSDGSHPGVELYFRRMAQGGTRMSGSVNHKTTIANGLAVLRRLSARHQEAAEVEVEVYARSNDGASPIVYDEAAALPSHNAGPDAVWTVGPIDVDGTTLQGIESVEVDPGVQVVSEGRDSDVYPTFCSIRSVQPSIRVRTRHLDITTSLTEDGLYKAAGEVIVYFRKRAEGGTFVADATAEHISLTLGKCRIEPQAVEGDPKTIDLLITPWATIGTSAPIAVSTTAAIE